MDCQSNQRVKTIGHKRKILTDVERALRRVQKYTAFTKPLEIRYIEPKLKKHKKSWLLEALSEENYNDGETIVNFSTTSTHKLQKQLDFIYCHAMRLEYEPPTFCCTSGYIQLGPDEVVEDLYKLFTDESKEAILIRKHIRAYNSIFAFTSFGVQLNKELASSRKGIYSFKYPLILPNGEGGWHQGIVKSRNPNIAIPTYTTTAANISPRSYASATEVLNNEEQAECRGEKVGKRVLPPGSFIGGPKDMQRRYMDAMALVQEYGRPDLFITMTCNPEWTEIQEQLCAGQVAQDHPYLLILQKGKEAAKERGLLESDDSISECLREAVNFKMHVALRMLFATILVHCNPTDVRRLWDTYYNDMSDDLQRTHAKSPEAKLQSTLKSVNSYLESMGQSVAKFDMPQIQQELYKGDTYECREIVEERFVKVPTEDMEAQSKLNEQQTQAFKTILQRTDSGTP
ncbi:hypothetical protein KY284_035878 [Solanum tuberosum]|nr:hypothetical protein KY284_035878 [Solanum tuberosum]